MTKPHPAGIHAATTDEWHAVLSLTGEFDVASAPTLRDAIAEQLDAGRRVIHLDTSGVTFMDSTAIGVIVSMHVRCRDEQGSLILTGVHGTVARLVEVTGLDRVLLIDNSGTPE